MPRVLNFPKAIDERIRVKRTRITELERELQTLEQAKAVFQPRKRGPGRPRKQIPA